MERYTRNNVQRILRAMVLSVETLIYLSVFHLLMVQQSLGLSLASPDPKIMLLYTVGALLWVGAAMLTGLNDQEGFINPRFVIKWGLICMAGSTALITLFFYNIDALPFSMNVPLSYAFALAVATFPIRLLFIQTYRYRRVFFRDSRIMIVGNGKSANDLNTFFQKHKAAKLIHMLNGETKGMTEPELLTHARAKVPEIKQMAVENGISEIYWNLPLSATDILEEMGEFAQNNYINFRITNDFNYLNQEAEFLGFIDEKPIITLRNPPLASFANRQMKRIFDLFFSSLFLLLVFPWLLLIVGIMIKLDSRGPIFFIQPRAGKKNNVFPCFKFRTMTVRQEESEYQQATKNDARITKVGAFLRKTNLDEMPQFINVFLGDMSVIGPRPHPPKLDEMHVPNIRFYQYRYYIKPGISGWAQVHGFRGETSEPGVMDKRIEHDNWYIENWSLLLDLKIVFMTVFNMVKGEENAY